MVRVRTTAFIVMAGVLASVVPTAWAATRSFDGSDSGTGSVSFDLKTRNGVQRVVDLTFDNDKMSCGDGPTASAIVDTIFPRIDVNRHEFHKTVSVDIPGFDGTVKVKGTLRKHNTKASGTFRSTYATFDTQYSDCDTGLLTWTATH
jgi:hypothetical protein